MGVRGEGGEVSCRLRLRSKENRKHSAVREVRARKVLREGRVGSSHTWLDNVFAYMRPSDPPSGCPACLLSEVVNVLPLVNVNIGRKQGKHMKKKTIQSPCVSKSYLLRDSVAFFYSNTPLSLSNCL